MICRKRKEEEEERWNERTNESKASTLKEKLRENFWVKKKLSRDEQLELSLTVGQIFYLDCCEQVFFSVSLTQHLR
jgi:hypothetical protein